MKRMILAATIAVFTLSGLHVKAQSNPANDQRFKGEERSVADFTGVYSGGYFNVFITIGEKESLRIEADAATLKDIETKVEKGILKIQLNSKKRYWDWNTSDRKKVNIFISAKVLTNVSASGSGNMKVEGTIKAPDFRVSLSGSGNLDLNVESVNLAAVVSGSGNMRLGGNSQNAQLMLSGSGNLAAVDFKAKNAEVSVSGSGNVNLKVEKKLKAITSGSGNIRYDGDPEIEETRSGSGKILKM